MPAPTITALISRDAARCIAYDWHGGQMSGLYSFASTGTPGDVELERAIREVREEIAMLPGGKAHTDFRRLGNLLRFLRAEAQRRGLEA